MNTIDVINYYARLYLSETKYFHQLFNYNYQKVGGIYFIRLGDFQFSFCISSKWRNK